MLMSRLSLGSTRVQFDCLQTQSKTKTHCARQSKHMPLEFATTYANLLAAKTSPWVPEHLLTSPAAARCWLPDAQRLPAGPVTDMAVGAFQSPVLWSLWTAAACSLGLHD